MSEWRLDDLIREINPESFSATAHGEGHRVVHSAKETRQYRKSLLERFTGSREDRHYFVKQLRVPKEIKDWKFHWSEGTSAISLDFDSNFVIQANEDIQALKLVKVLARNGKPGDALHGLINEQLHAALDELLRECNAGDASLLDFFRQASIGVGESQRINTRVSKAVSHELGGCHFRIGFQLRNAPPLQIEIQWPEEFKLADSTRAHEAKTTALLQLVNYQAYKRSGLETAEAIKASIHRSISLAVKQLLFGRKYYDVVDSFQDDATSVKTQMRERIEKEARNIGYHVSLFQTFPDVAALEVLEWMRIEMEPVERRYSLKNSTNGVKVAVDLSVRAEGDFSNLRLLIRPDHTDVKVPIRDRVAQIVRDTLLHFDWQQFNLEFDTLIKPALVAKIKGGLRSCGLATQVLRIASDPTEDATRFKALRSGTVDFEVVVSPQANVGAADLISLQGKVTVTDIGKMGWESFEAKDFGFRSDSRITETKMRQLAALRKLEVPVASPLPAAERQSLAIELELLEIRDRVVSALRESMSKVKNLAANWRSLDSSRKIIKWAEEEICTQVIEKEFGLKIALRGVVRGDTATEATTQMRRLKANELARELLVQDVERELTLRKASDGHEVTMLTSAGGKDMEALEDEDHERHAVVREAAAARLTPGPSTPRLTADSIQELLDQPEPETDEELPWLPSADPQPDARGPVIGDGSR